MKKVNITTAQLKAIIDMRDDIEAMMGTGDSDSIWRKNVKLVNRFLSNNNISPSGKIIKTATKDEQ